MDIDTYSKLISVENLYLAYRKARRHKTLKPYVKEFEEELFKNITEVHKELKEQRYYPKPLESFILRDPKTRVISKSEFRDRIVHHAIINVIEPTFDKSFIYDSCANRLGKGNLFALKRLDKFKRKVTKNSTRRAFCLKADIKHYFQEVNHEILINLLGRKIKDERVTWLIKKILDNFESKIKGIGMPLGNLTSQFFANVYLNELDHFVKHELRARYYLRYVDDFIIVHESREQLETWKRQIDEFLRQELKIELHPQKSKIVFLSRGVDFVGFRNFLYHRLLRKRNIKSMQDKIQMFGRGMISKERLLESLQGWNAYAKWANSFKLQKKILYRLNSIKLS